MQRADRFCLKYCHLKCGVTRISDKFSSPRADRVRGVTLLMDIVWPSFGAIAVTSTGRQRIDLLHGMIGSLIHQRLGGRFADNPSLSLKL